MSTKHAIAILAKKSIQVDEDEATVILNFLYLVTKVSGHVQGGDMHKNPLAEIEP